jgi:hypothetical protein
MVSDVGLAVFDEVQLSTREQIQATVQRGMRSNPLEILQISDKRGRLDVACPYVAGNRRMSDPKWVERCNQRSKK